MPFSARYLVRRLESGQWRIAAVDEDVSLFDKRQDLFNHVVNGVARLHHQHDAPRRFEQLHKLGHRMRAHHLGACRFILEEIIHLGDGSIEDRHLVTVVIHV